MLSTRKLYVPTPQTNHHVAAIQKYFGKLERAEADIPANVKFVFICYTNRCGSNYVAELLASDEKLPLAGENLNFDTVIDFSSQKNLTSFQEYFSFLVKRQARNGVFTLKIAPAHIDLLGRSGILEQIIDRSHFILVERADKLGQAISHLIAFQTGRFTSTMAGNEQKEPEFNRSTIQQIVNGIAEEYELFSLFFGHNGIIPAYLIYEQVIQFPFRSIIYIGDSIGMPGLQIKQEKLSLSRQSGALNQEWRELYLATPASAS